MNRVDESKAHLNPAIRPKLPGAPRHRRHAARLASVAAVSVGVLVTGPVSHAQEVAELRAVAEFRSIDGSGNNPFDPSIGMSGIPLLRQAPNAYADGVSAMAGSQRPSARAISNALVDMPIAEFGSRAPTDYLWAWGQFIDHDISITEGAEPAENAPIPVPTGDPWFDPQGAGGVVIPFHRSVHDTDTGTGTSNPREQINQITAWIDASNVYGSDEVRAAALRLNDGSGRLRTSARNMLPFNTDGLPNAGGTQATLFLAGDVRANEQVGLTALHTLFVREHNRLAEALARRSPRLSGERIYQRARRIVGAQLQMITYEEFLPVLLGRDALPAYSGYRPLEDAGIRNEFSTSLYRFGHSAIGSRLLRLNRRGRETRFGHLSLADAFFSPQRLITEGGLEPVLRGLAAQVCQPVDLRITNELRSFLFGPPGAGGLDLAALNIQRGRDHGIPDYNTVRSAYGLSRVATFADVSSRAEIQTMLSDVYGSVDDIDAWVGALAEDSRDGMVGELLGTAIAQQFVALRDGDRFWYEGALRGWERRQLAPLSRIIRRNTRIGTELPRNVFTTANTL